MINSKLSHIILAMHWLHQKHRPLTWAFALSLSIFGLVFSAMADSLLITGPNGAGIQASAREPAHASTNLSSYYAALQSYTVEGPYHQNSSEVLYNLGLELQKAGQHTKALKALRRAMHINRVNHGLDSLSQAPMIGSIINSQKHLMNFGSVTNRYHQLLRMYVANYGKQDPRLIPLLNRLALWHIDAYQFAASKERIDHLTLANSLITSALQLHETQTNPGPREEIKLLRSAALINFHLSRHQGDEWSTSINSHYSRSADDFAIANPQRVGILNIASFHRGRVCHERIVELSSSISTLSLKENLRAQTELADWYLLFNRRQEALLHYQQVLEKISASDQAESLHKALFSTPHLLPAVRMENRDDKKAVLLMTADVDISEEGWARDIKNIEEVFIAAQGPRSETKLRYMLIGAIKDSRFRPQFVNNQPTDVSDTKVEIPLIH